MISSINRNGVSYADALRQTNKQENREKIPEFIPPKLINMERKLQIQNGEWYEESYYKSDDVAALYAFY